VIAAICALGIVIVGVSIMVGIVNLEDALRRIGHGFFFIFLGFIAVCVMRLFLKSVLIPSLDAVKPILLWLVGIALVLALLLVILRWGISKLE